MSTMKQRPNYVEDGITKKSGSVDVRVDNEPKPSNYRRFVQWYQGLNDSMATRFVKFLISLGVAYGVRVLVYSVWFDHAVFSADPSWDFWEKTAIIFCAAAGLLVVLNSAMKSEGNTTALALILFFSVSCAQHYVKRYYDSNGNSRVFIDSRKGYLYLEEEVIKYADIKTTSTGVRYFIHPTSGDTCWNDSPKKLEHYVGENNQNFNSDYNPPTEVITYKVRKEPYVITLKAGETLDHWITFNQDRSVRFEILSDNNDYTVFFSETDKYYGGSNDVIPDHDPSVLFLKAGKTDQIITMKLSYY